MAGSRAPMRYASVALALLRWGIGRRRPPAPARILVLHHLLLGDTLMLTALLAKLRARHPRRADRADRAARVRRALCDAAVRRHRASARSARLRHVPRAARAAPIRPRDPARRQSLVMARARDRRALDRRARRRPARAQELAGRRTRAVFRRAHGVLRDRRGTRAGRRAGALRDRAVGAPPPRTTCRRSGNATRCCTSARARHSSCGRRSGGARSRRWLEARGLDVVWSAGPGEAAILDAVDPASTQRRIAGTLSLPQLWHLAGTRAPARVPGHRRRASGPHRRRADGDAVRPGLGRRSADPASSSRRCPGARSPWIRFPCRDQTIQFFREVPWARRCERLFGDPPARCPRARCMEAIDIDRVTQAIEELDPFAAVR